MLTIFLLVEIVFSLFFEFFLFFFPRNEKESRVVENVLHAREACSFGEFCLLFLGFVSVVKSINRTGYFPWKLHDFFCNIFDFPNCFRKIRKNCFLRKVGFWFFSFLEKRKWVFFSLNYGKTKNIRKEENEYVIREMNKILGNIFSNVLG